MPLSNDVMESVKAITGNGSTPLKRPRKQKVKPLVTDAVLAEEVQYVKGKLKDWMDTIRTRQDRERKKILSQQDGTAVDCSCCFDSYPMDDMVACRDEGHLFCQDCLKSVVENLVFGQGNLGIDKSTKKPALELICFHGDGCSSGFHRACLEKALPLKTLQKYDEVQFQVSIEQAGLCDVCSCPKCGFQADVPPEQKVFQCPVAECRYESCRDCGEAAHIPLRYVASM
jgi:TRIAD3 protein (E3 ubiquitin-protein ligase RNF216)